MYQVKFKPPGNRTYYGIVASYGDDVEEAKKNGEAIVEDAILPKSYRVPLKELIEIESDFGKWNPETHEFEGGDEMTVYISDEFKKAKKLSESLSDELQRGKLFSVHVGDGQAWYVVVKVNKKTCRVEWRGFSPDRWTDNVFGWGGTFSIDVIEPLVRRYSAMRSLFHNKD